MSELIARVNPDNPDPRVACALLLDTSGSMGVPYGDEGPLPIAELNKGFRTFCDEIKKDPLAKKRTEVSVITFGGQAQVAIPFTEGRNLEPRDFIAGGPTPLGAALELGMAELTAQKKAYRDSGLEYFRPWLFVITDGSPTDGSAFESAVAKVRQAEAAKGVTVFSVGVGDNADMVRLEALSATRKPVQLKGLSFVELFEWLSASMSIVSNSGTFGSSDSSVAQAESGEQNPLPPPGWANW